MAIKARSPHTVKFITENLVLPTKSVLQCFWGGTGRGYSLSLGLLNKLIKASTCKASTSIS